MILTTHITHFFLKILITRSILFFHYRKYVIRNMVPNTFFCIEYIKHMISEHFLNHSFHIILKTNTYSYSIALWSSVAAITSWDWPWDIHYYENILYFKKKIIGRVNSEYFLFFECPFWLTSRTCLWWVEVSFVSFIVVLLAIYGIGASLVLVISIWLLLNFCQK